MKNCNQATQRIFCVLFFVLAPLSEKNNVILLNSILSFVVNKGYLSDVIFPKLGIVAVLQAIPKQIFVVHHLLDITDVWERCNQLFILLVIKNKSVEKNDSDLVLSIFD